MCVSPVCDVRLSAVRHLVGLQSWVKKRPRLCTRHLEYHQALTALCQYYQFEINSTGADMSSDRLVLLEKEIESGEGSAVLG